MIQPIGKYNRSLIIRSHKDMLSLLPTLSENNTYSIQKQRESEASKIAYENRMHELQGSIRILEKKYKQNLKEGFESKIKSYRLQAVMERKIIKATLEDTKRQIQEEERMSRIKKAQSEKEHESRRNQKLAYHREYEKRKLRKLAQLQKQEMKEKIRMQELQMYSSNKQIHDNIKSESEKKDRKKVYFENIKKKMNQRSIEKEKKQILSRIIENTDTLNRLQNQLTAIANNSKTRQIAFQGPFITI